ncbi:hypothetical protein [Tessaracoccus antarcticus]|nr:hypothetical protein [Tessaracoccus antarcticus]
MTDDPLAGRGEVLIGAALRTVEQVEAVLGCIRTPAPGVPPILP